MAKILITGENSFVGRNYIDNSIYDNIDEVCLLKNKVADVSFKGYDVVLHLAAIVHQTKKISEAEYFRINTDLCIQVAKEAKNQGIHQFVFLSTVKVYGDYRPEKGPWTEYSDCEPNDSYGKSKYAAELELKKLVDDNFQVAIIRPPLIYGVGVKANMLSIIKLIDKFSILPLGDIKNRRSFTSIENLVQLIDTAIQKKVSGIFLAMDEEPLSTTRLVEIISKHLNKHVKLFKLPGFIIFIGKKLIPRIFDRLYGSFEIDNTFTRETLDFNPRLSSKDGIGKMVKDYMNKM